MNLFESVNPFNLEKIYEFPESTSDQIQGVLLGSQKSFESWHKRSFQERAELFLKLSQILNQESDRLALLMTQEMGKLLTESKSEIKKCAGVCAYYAENSEKLLRDQEVKTDADLSFVSFQPLGVILAIMPWNFPFWQVFRFAAPTLMAGNTCVLKHSSNVSACALEIEKLFLKAGFPKNVFNTLLVKSDKIAKIIADPIIKAVSLTGSIPAGKSVAASAGQNLKKCVLELGGSDAYVVLDDANLQQAIDVCSSSRLINAGQSCVAAKRFIITQKNYDQFKEGFIQKFQSLKMGDPTKASTSLAPLFSKKAQEDIHQQVLNAKKNGAQISYGGNIPNLTGAFYEPTLIENISSQNPSFYEEFFGPVAMFFKVSSQNEAFQIANATPFGLGGAVFGDIQNATRLAREELEAGSCFVNSFVKSDYHLPFGGIKQSGYGRELSHFGIHEFVNIKTVFAKK